MKDCLPFLSKRILEFRYLLIYCIRVGSILAYFSPFIGLLGIMNHYQAETISLDYSIFDFNDGQYKYWNPVTKKIQSEEGTEENNDGIDSDSDSEGEEGVND